MAQIQGSGRDLLSRLAVQAGVPAHSCNCALKYLIDPEGEPCFGYYYENDLVKNRPEGIVFHCASVFSGTPRPNNYWVMLNISAFIEWSFVLNDNYNSGQNIRTCALNPISGEELDLDVIPGNATGRNPGHL